MVAAILKSGLRIMPHSGGRVGSGIYFASENAKSIGYGKKSPKKTIPLSSFEIIVLYLIEMYFTHC